MTTEPPASQDPKRLFLFMILSLVLITGTNFLLARFGLLPEPEKPEPAQAWQVAEVGDDRGAAAGPATVEGQPDEAGSDAEPASPDGLAGEVKAPSTPETQAVATIDPNLLVLGAAEGQDAGGYHLQVFAAQEGASIRRVLSSLYNAEYEDNKPRQRPMTLVRSVTTGHRPLAMQILVEDEEGGRTPVGDLDRLPWQVVVDGVPFDELDEAGRSQARPVEMLRDEQGNEIGQRLRFRSTLREPGDQPPVVITKTYSLRKGADAVELGIEFALPDGVGEPRQILYRLDGPSGVPIEGKWYTQTFRNAFFAKGDQARDAVLWTYSSYDVANDPDNANHISTELPTAFAGVENQYFATFLKPESPRQQVAEAVMTVVDSDPKELKEADVAVDLISTPIELEPGKAATHSYTLYAGPKTDTALGPHDAQGLAIYRQVGRIPIIGWLFDILWAIVDPIVALLSVYIIGPLLANIYRATATIAGWFGGTRGSYGVAIILLTVVVRLALFPLSRKQAASAKKMQDLQPHMVALREKYGDDRERVAQETFALYRKHGINPLGGCLPVFVQIPIFMTLWRVLNVSVSLRQAQFLWIDNLAAPDMLMKLPFELPLLGPYFNLLPLGVIGLFLVQMKLFTPPATTPEQEAQQRIMKFMMVFMMLMFYRVPAGLALYFITSSMWAIGERLLLPKVTKSQPIGGVGEDGVDPDGKGRGPGKGPDPNGNGGPGKGPDPNGGNWLSRKLDELMKEASKANETTYRRNEPDRPRRELERGPSGPDPEADRPRPKKKTKPGKRR